MAKLTESQLRSIIKEELKRVLEAHDDMDYGQKALNEEESVTFTVKEHVKSHFGTVGIVKTVGTYDSFEEAKKVAKQGNRYIVSSKGEQFYPNSNF